MFRKIAIVDESNPEYSNTRAASLFGRLEQSLPSVSPPLQCSWELEICPANQLPSRIRDFWLAWVHDGWDRTEFEYAKTAVIVQERNAPGSFPTAVVFYGGGADSFFPTARDQDDPAVIAVLSRMMWLQRRDLAIEDFSYGDGSTLNFDGFLMRASEWFPRLGPEELSMLCDSPRSPDEFKPSTITHTAKPVLREIEKNLLAGMKGDLLSRERFLTKADTVVNEIDKLRGIVGKVERKSVRTRDLNRFSSDLLALRNIVDRFRRESTYSDSNIEQTTRLLESLTDELKTIGQIAESYRNSR